MLLLVELRLATPPPLVTMHLVSTLDELTEGGKMIKNQCLILNLTQFLLLFAIWIVL